MLPTVSFRFNLVRVQRGNAPLVGLGRGETLEADGSVGAPGGGRESKAWGMTRVLAWRDTCAGGRGMEWRGNVLPVLACFSHRRGKSFTRNGL